MCDWYFWCYLVFFFWLKGKEFWCYLVEYVCAAFLALAFIFFIFLLYNPKLRELRVSERDGGENPVFYSSSTWVYVRGDVSDMTHNLEIKVSEIFIFCSDISKK